MSTRAAKKPKLITLESVWEIGDVILNKLLRKLDEGVDRNEYAAFYTEAYSFLCANSNGAEFYAKIKALLEKYVDDVSQETQALPDEELLKRFRKLWNDFKKSTGVINNLFRYLNRTWVRTMQNSQPEDYFQIDVLGDVTWRVHFFEPYEHRLMGATLALVKRLRDGEPVDTTIVSDMTQCLVQIGAAVPHKNPLDLYVTSLEKPFLAATDVYYTVESTSFLHENGVSEYLKKAERRIAEEFDRLGKCLHPSSAAALHATLDDVLVKKHLGTLHAKATPALVEDRRDDLKRLYALLARCGRPALLPFADAVEKFIALSGRDALSAEADAASANPDVFVAILLRVYRRFNTLIKEAMNNDASFIAAQDKAFREFVNKNDAVLKEDKQGGDSSIARAPQLIAKYCDMILRKGPKHISDEAEMERTLDDVVALFKYLLDKDVFALVYRKLLSKRLIQDISGNDDYELAMINKLKMIQGVDFTSKLLRMVQDIATSKDITSGFKAYCETQTTKLEFDCAINVLASGTWPFSPPATAFNPPDALNAAMALFHKFYNTKYQGRKLTYLHQTSTGELAVTYLMKGRLRVIVSTYQMGVLLHYDKAAVNTATYGELRAATSLDDQTLKTALLGFLKMKFVSSSGGPKHTAWNDGTAFALSGAFVSKRTRVTLNVPVVVEGLKTVVVAQVEAPELKRERELKLQAAIVRIMKARRVLDHNNLIAEATTQVQKWFAAKVTMIKKVVEDLIEQEYMKRSIDENGDTINQYEYVA